MQHRMYHKWLRATRWARPGYCLGVVFGTEDRDLVRNCRVRVIDGTYIVSCVG